MTEAVRGERSEPWGCVWTEQGQGPGEVGGCACSGTKKGPVWSESREGGRRGRKQAQRDQQGSMLGDAVGRELHSHGRCAPQEALWH